MTEILNRDVYLSRVEPFIDKDIIKVFTGQRRVGKSCLMLQVMRFIDSRHQPGHIIYINKEDYQFDKLNNDEDLYRYILKNHSETEKNYIFIDEIQEIAGFEKVLRDFNARVDYDIYCTGSNSNMLSGELATHLSGRYIEINIHSLSFAEFMQFHQLDKLQATLLKFLKYGGLPYLIHLELKDEIVFGYLKSIFNTIILKDVVSRHNIRNVNFLERLVKFLADNTGQILSAKRISDYLKSQQVKLSTNSVLNYLSFLTESYFIRPANRYDVVGKRLFEVQEKYYFEDLGLRHTLVGFRQVDIGKVLENAVFNHLEYVGYTVLVGKLGDREIDFVAVKDDNTVYVQVCYLLPDQQVIEREFGNLLAIKDNYRKIVVSMDEFAAGDVKGVEHQHILDFLTTFH
ncbi:MAG: ATP-binding protein [Thermodesulfobacteriota bacterium]|nr:ATP-binding protein [Thermodesulfobacteriota bacterium]